MSPSKMSDQLAVRHFHALRAAIAHSPIVLAAAPPSARGILDWDNLRKSPDVDALILAWIAGHVRGGTVRSTVH
jgi:hypothetical protein